MSVHGPAALAPTGRPPTSRFAVLALVLVAVPLVASLAGVVVALASGAQRLSSAARPDAALVDAVTYPEPPGFERMDVSVPGHEVYRRNGARVVVWLFEPDLTEETVLSRLADSGISVRSLQRPATSHQGVAWLLGGAETQARDGRIWLGRAETFRAAVVELGRDQAEKDQASRAGDAVAVGMRAR